MEKTSYRNPNWRTGRLGLYRLIAKIAGLSIAAATCPELRADIPWPEVGAAPGVRNEKLARRPQGHNANTLSSARCTTRRWNRVSLLNAALMQRRSQNRDCMAARMRVISFAQ